MCTEDDPRVHISLLGFSGAVKTCARAFICSVKKLPWKFLVSSQHKSSLAVPAVGDPPPSTPLVMEVGLPAAGWRTPGSWEAWVSIRVGGGSGAGGGHIQVPGTWSRQLGEKPGPGAPHGDWWEGGERGCPGTLHPGPPLFCTFEVPCECSPCPGSVLTKVGETPWLDQWGTLSLQSAVIGQPPRGTLSQDEAEVPLNPPPALLFPSQCAQDRRKWEGL